MALTLSKRIPAHTKTITALWCKKDFMLMSERYREIRSKCRSPMDACYWCGHKFINGEMMALASFEEIKVGNKTLCQNCAGELMLTVSPADET